MAEKGGKVIINDGCVSYEPVAYQSPEIEFPEITQTTSPEVLARQQKEAERQENQAKLQNMMNILGMVYGNSPEDSNDSIMSTLGLLTGNTFAKGGKIHIKPSHRGRLTELKKRTGKTEAELYKTGSPATRKMITFARNARKWKHGLGGNLFEDGGELTPEEQAFHNYVVKASEDPMVTIAKQNPEYSQTLSDMYDTFLSKPQAERLLNVYNEAGRPRLKPLRSSENRAYTKNNIFASKPVMYLDSNGKDSNAGFYDLIAELSHPIQSKYGNNKSWKEKLNPFYHKDDYRGKTRYDFPNKYESETHEDFEPLLHYYVLDNWLPGQGWLTSRNEGEKEIGDWNHVFNPNFPTQVTDSARVYNKRKQDMNYQYKEPRGVKVNRNKMFSFLGNLF